MDPVTGIVAAQAVQGVTEAAQDAVSGGNSEFDALMRRLLPADSGNNVDEEALFAALLEERITALKGEEAGQQYNQALSKHKSEMARSDGYVPVEQAAEAALSDMVAAEVLTAEEGSQIRGQAFKAAQLDNNHEALYDGRGSENDPTVAIADMESALLSARAIIDQLENGELEVESEESEGTESEEGKEGQSGTGESEETGSLGEGGESRSPIDGEGGFLWKPEGEHSKQLVVLLPPDLANDVTKVLLRGENGNVVEEGTSTGFANGGREHFRFSKSGGDYPENLTVEVTLASGQTIEYDIPDPSQRYD